MITQQRLHEILDYDPNTGEFRWKINNKGPAKKGTIAGCKTICGKRYIIRIDGKLYYAHRLAWLHTYGKWPSLYLDHKNGNGLDNRILNLRDVTHQQNMQNLKKRKTSELAFTGVSWRKHAKKWMARINYNNKMIFLGYYDDIWDAICARKSAELVYQPLRVVSNQ